MSQFIQCERVSWKQVINLSYELAVQIRRSGFQPDLVVAIARGGYVPARMLCDYLEIYALTSMRIEHYTAGAEKIEQARVVMPLNCDIRKQKVLLVDDVDDTGDTIALAIDYLKQFHPAQIRVAVMHHKSVSRLLPDYYGCVQEQWRWLAYPWAVMEDVRGFMARLEPPPRSVAEVQQRLQSEFSLGLSREELENILRLYPLS